MAAPEITATTRYINPGTSVVLLVASISNILSPTRLELDAGLNVTKEVAEVSGWLMTGEAVPMPDLARLFTSSISGRISVGESSITYYADLAGVDIRSMSEVGTNSNVVWMDGGDVPGRLMDIFPTRVLSAGKTRSVDPTPGRLPVNYAITDAPAENIVIP